MAPTRVVEEVPEAEEGAEGAEGEAPEGGAEAAAEPEAAGESSSEEG